MAGPNGTERRVREGDENDPAFRRVVAFEQTMLRRYARFVQRFVKGALILVFFVFAALVAAGVAIDESNSRDDAIAELARENSRLIERIDASIMLGRERGAETDLRQCRELNDLRRLFREEIRSSLKNTKRLTIVGFGADDFRLIERQARQQLEALANVSCTDLPNAQAQPPASAGP